MKKKITGLGMTLFLVMIFSVVLHAEVFQGEVKSVSPGGITVVMKDPATGSVGSEKFQVQTSRETQLKNFASLEELRPDDEVIVSGKWDEKLNYWKAEWLSVVKAKIKQ